MYLNPIINIPCFHIVETLKTALLRVEWPASETEFQGNWLEAVFFEKGLFGDVINHSTEMARALFPGKNFNSYWPQNEIWAFQCFRRHSKQMKKKKKKDRKGAFLSRFPVLCGSSKVYFATKPAEVGCNWLSPSFIQSEYLSALWVQ